MLSKSPRQPSVVVAAADSVTHRVIRLALHKVNGMILTPKITFKTGHTLCAGGRQWEVKPSHTIELVRKFPSSTVGILVYVTAHGEYRRMLPHDHTYYDLLINSAITVAWEHAELHEEPLVQDFGS